MRTPDRWIPISLPFDVLASIADDEGADGATVAEVRRAAAELGDDPSAEYSAGLEAIHAAIACRIAENRAEAIRLGAEALRADADRVDAEQAARDRAAAAILDSPAEEFRPEVHDAERQRVIDAQWNRIEALTLAAARLQRDADAASPLTAARDLAASDVLAALGDKLAAELLERVSAFRATGAAPPNT